MSGILQGIFKEGVTPRQTKAASADITAAMARAIMLRYARKISQISVDLPGLSANVGKFRNAVSAGKTRLLDYHSDATLDILTARRYVSKILAQSDGSKLTLAIIFRPMMGYNPTVTVTIEDFASEDLVRYARMSEDELASESEATPDQV